MEPTDNPRQDRRQCHWAEQRQKWAQGQHQARGTSKGPIQTLTQGWDPSSTQGPHCHTPSPEMEGSWGPRGGGCGWRLLVKSNFPGGSGKLGPNVPKALTGSKPSCALREAKMAGPQPHLQSVSPNRITPNSC